ncbi:MAG: protoporphyrinogen oxidase HemJ [Pseudomonadota bacterium]
MRDFLLSNYLWIKGFHIIFVIAWMAGMMYLPRLFIYHHQSARGGEAANFFITMERRLLKGIMTPSLVVVWLLALTMIYANPDLLKQGWFHLKLVAVLGISAVHGYYAGAYRKFADDQRPQTEKFWRIINEVPFVLMIIAALMAVTKLF